MRGGSDPYSACGRLGHGDGRVLPGGLEGVPYKGRQRLPVGAPLPEPDEAHASRASGFNNSYGSRAGDGSSGHYCSSNDFLTLLLLLLPTRSNAKGEMRRERRITRHYRA